MEKREIIELIQLITPWLSGSVAGVIITLFVNYRVKRKNRKVISIDTDHQIYSLNSFDSNASKFSKELNVTYGDDKYSHLALYQVSYNNNGNKKIDKSKLVFLLPARTVIVEKKINSSPLQIQVNESVLRTEKLVELHFDFENVEVGDKLSFTFLLDCEELEKIKVLVRESDDAVVRRSKSNSLNDIEYDIQQLAMIVGTYIFLGSIPFLGKMIQGLVFVTAIPVLIRLFRFYLNKRKENNIEINTLNMKDDSSFHVNTK
ncbi:MAG: hypothetical protein R8G66_18130 [Cytophagales bacterium]|nr:hypothetical protein [Cytophagales bacterium]